MAEPLINSQQIKNKPDNDISSKSTKSNSNGTGKKSSCKKRSN